MWVDVSESEFPGDKKDDGENGGFRTYNPFA
jgi:hypothetical protein